MSEVGKRLIVFHRITVIHSSARSYRELRPTASPGFLQDYSHFGSGQGCSQHWDHHVVKCKLTLEMLY